MQTAAYLCVVRDFSNAALIAHLSFSAAESTGMACIPKKPIALNCAYKRENGEAMSRLLCRKVCPSTKRFLSYVKSLRAGRVIQQEFEQWPNKRRVRVGVINGGKFERGSDELDISALEDETKMRVEKGTKGKSDEDQWARIQSLGIAGSLPNEAKSRDLINAEDQATKAASSVNKSSKKGVGAVATAAKSTAMAEVSTVLLVDNREAVVIDDTAKGAAETKQEYNRFRKNNDALFWRKVGKAKDADEALGMICEEEPGRKGEISSWECSQLILAAVEEDNLDLAFSILDAVRRSRLLPKEIVQKQGMSIFILEKNMM
ncbi:hypothetical protein O6H91_22G002800 [Diphasiastrum complanatum]|uniref:Uncharacterized protein n=1 Tax=Diphasiastrum complanatum TaxID=34168 RepID=A0ACC2ACB1_DIPCM|nr:hypothetical protein O6H91_22G002800 [Diphasiastrum complanatum]